MPSSDYTKWRKGRMAGSDGTIGICPKCGRKGAIRMMHPNGLDVLVVTHKADDKMGLWMATDNCFIKQERSETATR